jgi:hypothetical protein
MTRLSSVDMNIGSDAAMITTQIGMVRVIREGAPVVGASSV